MEINQLRAYDIYHPLSFEDIYAPDFVKRYPYIDQVKADRILHGQLSDGQMVYGLWSGCHPYGMENGR